MKESRAVLSALVVVSVGVLTALVVPKFIRGETSPKNNCINNLRVIDGAKQMWASEHKRSEGDVPTWADLKPYLTRPGYENLVKCPLGGAYTIGAVSNLPSCSIPDHVLPK
jgi:hypothetical protein